MPNVYLSTLHTWLKNSNLEMDSNKSSATLIIIWTSEIKKDLELQIAGCPISPFRQERMKQNTCKNRWQGVYME